MPKRSTNIYKRKDGRWEGRYIKGRKENGRAIYGSVYGKTYGEVKSKLEDIQKRNVEDRIEKSREKTFEEVLELWMKENRIKYKGTTEDKYRYLIDTHIIPELGKIKVASLSVTQVNEFLEKKLTSGRLDHQGGLSQSYVRSMMLIINSALQFAVNEKMRPPLNTKIYKPKAEQKKIEVLSREEQQKLEQYLYSDIDLTKLGILISLQTGMRIGEVCALKWENIDLRERVIHVQSTVKRIKNKEGNESVTKLVIEEPKTKASIRDIPISSKLQSVLLEMVKNKVSPYVISEKEFILSPRTYESRYHRILEKCGLKSRNYHVLRHTFATRCVEAGVDVKSLSEILGHANVSITLDTYVHSSMELKHHQIEKLAFVSA